MSDQSTPREVDEYDYGHFIDGEFVPGSGNTRLQVENPANGETVGTVPDGTPDDVDTAVGSAKAAYETTWRHLSASERGEYLFEIADEIHSHRTEFVEIETMENGKLLEESRNDVEAAIDEYRYYGGAADKFHGETVPERAGGYVDRTVHEPYGVVGSIIPWNWPPMHSADFTATPLAVGNTVVLKPAPETPLSSLRMAEIWQDVLPDGVVNVVTGDAAVGTRLIEHPDVGKVAFTGHTTTGKEVMETAAEDLTSLMLELGGKNANVVLPDADLERAVDGVFNSIFYNQGQACLSGSRLLLPEELYDPFLETFGDRMEALTIGPGSDPDTTLGPMASRAQYEKVTRYIELGKEEGATPVFEGDVPGDVPDGGHYVPPVVFGDVTPDMRIAREEIFGPVLSVLPYRSVEDAIAIANDTEYGLAAGIWSTNQEVAERVARRLEVGMVFINNYYNGDFLGASFGGHKQSGMGEKLSFEQTLREYTRTKTLRSVVADTGVNLDTYYE